MTKATAQSSATEPADGASTRSRLLLASSSLIADRGWGAVTTRAVAERAGVNQALVHYHFGSIANLRRESVVARLKPEVDGLIEELLDDRPLPESIRRVMHLIDHFDLDTETGVLMAESLLQATRDPVMAEVMGGLMGSWGEMLGPRLAVAQERGVVRDDLPAAHLTAVLAAVLDGFLIQRMADPSVDADTTAATLIGLLRPAGEESS